MTDDLVISIRGAELRHSHAMKCDGTITIKKRDENGKVEKIKEPCPVCKAAMLWFSELPLHHLSNCLVEVPPPEAKFSLATLIMDSTFERGTHNTKRSFEDRTAGMRLLKDYEDMGGKLERS